MRNLPPKNSDTLKEWVTRKKEVFGGSLFALDYLLHHKMEEFLATLPCKTQLQEPVFLQTSPILKPRGDGITPDLIKIETINPKMTESLQNISIHEYLGIFLSIWNKSPKGTNGIELGFPKQTFNIGLDHNGEDAQLNWQGKEMGTVHTHEYWKFLRSTWQGLTLVLVLVRFGEPLSRRHLTRSYFQPLDPPLIEIYPHSKTVVYGLQYSPLDSQLFPNLGRKNIQQSLNTITKNQWIEAIQGSNHKEILFSSSSDQTKIKVLEETIDQLIAQFTLNHAFSYQFYPEAGKRLFRQLRFDALSQQLALLPTYSINPHLLSIGNQICDNLNDLHNLKTLLQNKPPWFIQNDFCISLDLIPDTLIPEILANPLQWKEWQNLIPNLPIKATDPEKFVAEFGQLMVDTKYFSSEFKYELKKGIPEFDDKIEGWIIKSENRRALQALLPRFRNQVDCIYTDPPYNTGNNEFVYRDSLKHSNWLNIMNDLLGYFPKIGSKDLNYFISIDDNEYSRFDLMIREKFGEDANFGPIIVQVNKGGRDYLPIAKTHEFLVAGSLSGEYSNFQEIPKPLEGKIFHDARGDYTIRELRNRNPKFNRSNRPNLFYPFYIDPYSKDVDEFCAVSLLPSSNHTIETIPTTSKKVEDCWRWSKEKTVKHLDSNNPQLSEIVARQKRNGGWNIYEKHRKVTTKAKSIWTSSDMRTESGTIEMRHLFTTPIFDHPKPVHLIEKCIQIGAPQNGLILDPFAGSGTSAQAIMNLNHRDGGRRRYILIEKKSYLDSVIIPRIKKLAYSLTWKEGKPILQTQKSKIVQYFTLEQLEDVFFNTTFHLSRNHKDEHTSVPKRHLTTHYEADAKIWKEWLQGGNYLKSNLPLPKDTLQYALKNKKKTWNFRIIHPYYTSKTPHLKFITEFPFMTASTPRKSWQQINLLETFCWTLGLNIQRRHIQKQKAFILETLYGKNQVEEIVILWFYNVKGLPQEDWKAMVEKIILGLECESQNPTLYSNLDLPLKGISYIPKYLQERMEFSYPG